MRRGSLFWGLLLLIVGGLLLLDTMEIIRIEFWQVIWPIALILIGLWVLTSSIYRGQPSGETRSVPLDSAEKLRIKINHAAGRVTLTHGDSVDQALEGVFGGGLRVDSSKRGDELEVTVKMSGIIFPVFPFTDSYDWELKLNPSIPTIIEMESGANDALLDLSDLKVEQLLVKTGASYTRVRMPENAGHTTARFEFGAASVNIEVPNGVAGRIQVDSGLSSTSIDRARFPKQGRVYQSEDFEDAANRVDITVSSGVGSLVVR